MAPLTAPTMDFTGAGANAPVYAQQALEAQKAWNQANTNLAYKKTQYQNTAGLNADGSVNGTNLTGEYQQMQRAQGQQLGYQHEADMSRNIGAQGIGAQNTSDLRYQNAVAGQGFKNNVDSTNQDFLLGGQTNFNTYQSSLLNLQLQAIADAQANQNFPTLAGGTGSAASGSGFYKAPIDRRAAKTVKVGSVSDVDPRLIALQAAARGKKTKPTFGYAQASGSNIH